jgi:predicted nucleic acid-binding protein
VILVDTSVWIDHFRSTNTQLVDLLSSTRVLIHPFVIGELACGNLRNRSEILNLLGDLPGASKATDKEVLFFIEQNGLMGQGIGYIDTHLLASVALTGQARLLTMDRRLKAVATEFDLAYRPSI